MENKYYVSYDLDEAELTRLSKDELMAQIRYYAHQVDKYMQLGQNDVKYPYDRKKLLDNFINKLATRLDIYENVYNISKPDLIWAKRIKDLYNSMASNQETFMYPWEDKPTINIQFEEFKKLITTRRSIRCFTNEAIPDKIIRSIIEFACWAPSACNMQALRYVVVKDYDTKKNIITGGFLGDTAYCVVAVIADYRLFQDWNTEGPIHNSAAAIQNMLISCNYFGIGACYVAGQNVNTESYKKLMNVKDYEKIMAFIWLGKYDKAPITPTRRDTDEIVEFI